MHSVKRKMGFIVETFLVVSRVSLLFNSLISRTKRVR